MHAVKPADGPETHKSSTQGWSDVAKGQRVRCNVQAWHRRRPRFWVGAVDQCHIVALSAEGQLHIATKRRDIATHRTYQSFLPS